MVGAGLAVALGAARGAPIDSILAFLNLTPMAFANSRPIRNLFSFSVSSSSQHALAWRGICHFASVLKDVQAGRDETQCFKGGWSIQHEEVGGFAFCYAIAILNA